MRKIIALTALALAAAACSSSPTSPDHADVRPRFDGGIFGGSGNAAGSPPAPTPNTTSAAGNEVTAADTVNGRGGVFGGSGN